MAGRTGQRDVKGTLIEIVIRAGGVAVANRNTGDARKHLTCLDLPQAIEIDATGGESPSAKNRCQRLITAAFFGCDHSELDRTIAATLQQAIGNATCR